ncbi:AAA-domain-containing protein [Jaminaea rosea]|uniref:AAA-domain-containing protein n=1 Tax=Jaminaea rosea TaxID=1569628 RepID=A0A316UNI5_9BASI|nr:AAA-domain-containing protein [Jaminaea rosea]PWN26847.1 AAA-domain-containing protein [Jaminaea rosea]
MNASITGGWAQHSRRSRVMNLNSSAPPAGSAAAAALAAKEAAANGEVAASSSSSAAPLDGAAPDSPLPEATGASTPRTREASPIPSSSKRKLRPSTAAAGPSSSSSKRSRRPVDTAEKYAPPTSSLSDLGGIAPSIDKILELIAMPLCHPEIYSHTGVKPPRGVLLHGPPGCGKTMLAGAVAGDLGVPFLSVSAPSIVSGTSGESEATLRQTFEEAAKIAPSILFIDEIDAITPKRETAGREMERRIVAQLLTCLDDLSWDKTGGRPVMVIGATNRPDALDAALRRAGRFDHEIALGVPDEKGREHILRVLAAKLRLAGDFDFAALAKATPGYVGADLTALASAAGILAVKRIFNELGQMPEGVDQQAAMEMLSVKETVDGANADIEMEEQQVDATATGATAPATPKVEANGDDQSQEQSQGEGAIIAPASAANGAEPPQAVTQAPTTTPASLGAVPTARFFSSLPTSLATSSIATFLQSHPSPLSSSQLAPLCITNADFLQALPSVQPSSKREGFATVPDVSWADVGALHETREELSMAIVEPIRRPDLFAAVGVQASSGVLLWGPPGCGKTLLAKAVANESRANFISVKGPELLNKYVGESERAVRQVFSRARTSAPCVIFFDELDALVPRRDDSLSESSSRVVNTLLTELDGLESRGQVYVIGATNRPDMIDPAMCRPGRLDKLLYVDLPSPEERLEILRTLTKKTPLEEGGVDLEAVAKDCRADGFSGADLANLAREAAVTALKAALAEARRAGGADGQAASSNAVPRVLVSQRHFLEALDKTSPSVSAAQRAKYRGLRSRLSGNPAGKARAGGAVSGTEGAGGAAARPAGEGEGAVEGGERGNGAPEMAV